LAVWWFTDAVIMVLSARTFAAISDVVRHDQGPDFQKILGKTLRKT